MPVRSARRSLVCAVVSLAAVTSGLALAAPSKALVAGQAPRTIGLEEWFDYESVETGAGSRAHVNLATGNLVWHSTPLVNPGRGLSTVLNLTYNEQDVSDGILHGLLGDGPDYDHAGRNFSLGISAVTRLGEPLDIHRLIGLEIGNTINLSDADGTRHTFTKQSDGVNFSSPSGVHMLLRRYSTTDAAKRLAMTRPDGITHFFDVDGYETSIEDRNGNVIRFTYEVDNHGLLGLILPPAKRVVRVTDSAGTVDSPAAPNRSFIVRYDDNDRIAEIDDHGGRKLRLIYDAQSYLRSMTEAAGTSAERVTRFDYGGSPSSLDLTSIMDPRGNSTYVAYDTGPVKRVTSIANRRSNITRFTYAQDPQNSDYSLATVTDPRGYATVHRLDELGRALKITDAQGTAMALTWDADNNPTRIVAAAGSSDEAVTDMTYNANGLLTSSTDGERHRTELRYRDGAGTLLNPLGTDVGRGFVSDLISYTTPKGTATATAGDFTETYAPDARGNVRSRTNAASATAYTDFDVRGQVISEKDEVGNLTTYSDFDPNGQPRKQIDPRDGVWRFRYDAVANTTAVVDPRNPDATGERFTTTLTYDALDRLVTERIPKDSANGVFVTKRYEFDKNSNQIATVDGTGARTEKSFTPMDDVEEHRSPVTGHFGEAPASEISWLRYDEDDNLLRLTHPNGTATEFGGDYLTAYTYDEVGQRVSETRRSRGDGPDVDLSTSYAYDRRGNVVGVVDPKRNAQFGGDPAANAKIPARRRLSYSYDRADNRTSAAEDPAGLNLRRQLRYDANDNKVAEVGPRGFAPGADPAKFTKTFEYDQRDLLVARIDAKGRREAYALRGDGKLVSETKPKGTASAAAGDYETRYTYLKTGELETWTLPEAPGQYPGGKGIVQYTRDPVGNPTKITDARGKSFHSTFLDTGDVASTERPSWWTINPTAGSMGGPAVAEKAPDELVRGGDASGARPREAEAREETAGDGGNVSPEPLPSLMPKAGLTRFGFDDELRLTSVTDVAGKVSRVGYDALGRTTSTEQPFGAPGKPVILQRFLYDRNGNLRQDRDGEDVATTYGYDQFDRRIRTTAAGTDEQPEEVTLDTFDVNGNLVARQLPRGASTTWRAGYDGLDRLVTRSNPARETTSFGYDEASNAVAERSPRGNVAGLTEAQREPFTTRSTHDEADQLITRRDGLGHETRFGYDLDGNQDSIDAPGAKRAADAALERRLTVRTFDGRDLPWVQTTGTGADERTTVREFDANGNLRREVNPPGILASTKRPLEGDSGDGAVAVNSTATKHATVREYSADNLLTSVHLPWGDRDAADQRRYRQDFLLDARGRVQSIDAPYDWSDPNAKAARTSYAHYDTGWIQTSSDQKVTDPDTGQPVDGQMLTYDYDRRGLQTLWKSSTSREMQRIYFANGKLRERKAVVPAQGSTPEKLRRYTYRYNANRSLITVNDLDKARITRMDYDVAERKRYVDEEWTRGKDTKFDYDANGNIVGRRTDGELTGIDRSGYVGGKLTNYAFDALDRETQMTVDPAGTVANRVATTEYWPSGEPSRRVKSTGVEETWFFANDGRLLRDRRAGGGVLAKDQEYRYDPNGNRSKDERGDHTFNARDQLVEWKRGEKYAQPGSKVSYDVNGSGAVTEERDEGANEVTKYTFDGDRLLTSTVNSGTPSQYKYDSFGSVKEIVGGPDAAKFAYDEFERMTMSSGDAGGSGSKTSTYEYDGMDRRDTETTEGKTQDFAYVGTTDQLSAERGRTGGKSEDYDYDSTEQLVGRALGQDDAETQGSYKEFGMDANGSVEGLEDNDGKISAGNQYQYDPYGKVENEAQLPDGPGKDNPFRFESFYFDSGVKQYDMRARNYRPEIGRFTSQDRFESAAKDFNLQSDPLTQNRYAFAGGNPVNRVEFDGHDIIDDVGLDEERDDAKDAVEDGAKEVKKAWDKKSDPRTEFGKGVVESVVETGDAVAHPRRTADGLKKTGESFAKDPVGSTKKAASAVGKCFENNAARCAGKTAAGIVGGKGAGAAAKGASALAKGSKASKAGAGASKGAGNRAGRVAPDCNSFVPGTPVLMADGTTKAIEQVRLGDLVLATTAFGQTAAFPVTDLITGVGEKHLARVTAGAKTTIVTLRHPYYLADEQRWIPAGSLSPGDRLRRPDGSTVVVEAVSQLTVLRARVHNLTVGGAHTYYAGGDPVLVHNARPCGGARGADEPKGLKDPGLAPKGKDGRIGGVIPDSPKGMSREQLEVLEPQLRRSIDVRGRELVRRGNKGNHGKRLAQESRLLRQIQKKRRKK